MGRVDEAIKALRGKQNSRQDYGNAAPGRFDVNRIARLPDEALGEFTALARKLVDPEKLAGRIPGLRSSRAAVRWAAIEEIQDLVLAALRARAGPGDPADVIRLAVERAGLEALILHPEFAYRWRMHLAARGPGSGLHRKSFVEFVSDPGNKKLVERMTIVLGDARLARHLPDAPGRRVTRRSWTERSGKAQRDAAVKSLNKACKKLGDDIFFAILFGKVGHLIPVIAKPQLQQDLVRLLRGGKAPDESALRNLDQAFDVVDPGALQSGFGEALAAARLIDRGKALAGAEGKPVYMLLGTRMEAVRDVVSGAGRRELARQPRALPSAEDLPFELAELVERAERMAEKAVPARSGRISGEAADSWLVTVDREKRMTDRIWAETKTSGDPPTAALEQFDHIFESIDTITRRQIETVVRIDKDAFQLLSPMEAAQALGGKAKTIDATIGGVAQKRTMVEVSEKPGFAEAVAKARREHEAAGGRGTGEAEQALRRERKFQHMRGAKRVAFMGRAQKLKVEAADTRKRADLVAEANRRGVAFEDYGDDYEPLRDLAMDVLAFFSFSR